MKPILIRKDLLKLSGKVYSEAFNDDPFISYVFPDLKEKPHIVPFYERLGFQVADEQQIPGTGLTNWAMIRNPNP